MSQSGYSNSKVIMESGPWTLEEFIYDNGNPKLVVSNGQYNSVIDCYGSKKWLQRGVLKFPTSISHHITDIADNYA